jgi:hypothetical protein
MPAWLTPWLSAGAFLGAIVTAVMTGIGWRKQRDLADRQAGHQRDLAERQAERSTLAARELENVKAELGSQLEGVKAELAARTRLETTAEEKRAEVAAAALVAIMRVVEAVRMTCREALVRLVRAAVEGEKDGPIGDYREELWARVRRAERRLQRSREQVHIHLATDVADLFARLLVLSSEIEMDQACYTPGIEDEPDNPKARFAEAFGANARSRLDSIEAEAKRMLRPIAQLVAGTPPKGLE